MLFKRKKLDMLEQKKKSLNTYIKQFDIAVSVVTTLIDTLTEANSNIDSTIADITDYQKELENTAEGLRSAKLKNEKVIHNFGALLNIE